MAGSERREESLISVTPSITLDEREIDLRFIRASGPGGQNVNKVATAVQLRFDVAHSPSLPEAVRDRLIRLAGNRITTEGVVIIDARRFRTQEKNREDAISRLTALIRRAAIEPRARRKTTPTEASKKRRIEHKQRRGATKRLRRKVRSTE